MSNSVTITANVEDGGEVFTSSIERVTLTSDVTTTNNVAAETSAATVLVVADIVEKPTVEANIIAGGAGPEGPPGPTGLIGPQGIPGPLSSMNSLNTLIGDVTLSEGTSIQFNMVGQDIEISTDAAPVSYVDSEIDNKTQLALVKNEVVGGTKDGVNTSFTLATSAVTGTVELYKNGIHLTPGAGNDYTVSGSAITMAVAPMASTVLLADYCTNTSVFQNGITGIVTNQVPTGAVNGSNTSFTTSSSYVAGTLEVWINGLKQLPTTHYTETTPASGVFTLGDAPLTGDNVLVNYQHTLSSLSDADKVDGFNASATPMANTLLPLNANAKIQQSVIQNDCKFSAYPTSNQATVAATWTKINNGTEEYDTGSNYNAGTSVFTAPATGYYSFTVSCLFNTQPGTAVLIGIGKNWTSGAETKRLGEIPNCTGNTTLTGTLEIYLTSGDTIVPLYYTASVTNLLSGSIYGRFQGKYVGA